eukprot:scaffold358735_cov19-Prasinocladus_malaysianus.AAC.1
MSWLDSARNSDFQPRWPGHQTKLIGSDIAVLGAISAHLCPVYLPDDCSAVAFELKNHSIAAAAGDGQLE